MKDIPGISFYDAITKLVTGFLLTWWMGNFGIINKIVSPASSAEFNTVLYTILCFVVGCLWCTLVDCVSDSFQKQDKCECSNKSKCGLCNAETKECSSKVCICKLLLFIVPIIVFVVYLTTKNITKISEIQSCFFYILGYIAWMVSIILVITSCIRSTTCKLFDYIPLGKRNYEKFLKEAYCSVYKDSEECDFTNGTKNNSFNIEDRYYQAYYSIQKNNLLGNIPVLESLEAFFRYSFLILPFYVNFFIKSAITSRDVICLIFAILVGLIFFVTWCATWYRTQMKIHKLVWEADLYLDIINKKKINNYEKINPFILIICNADNVSL